MDPLVSAVGMHADADESSDDDDAVGSLGAASKWLRKACAHHKSEGSVDAISNFLSKLDKAAVAKVLDHGNRNGKSALHFASQLRGDEVESGLLLRNSN